MDTTESPNPPQPHTRNKRPVAQIGMAIGALVLGIAGWAGMHHVNTPPSIHLEAVPEHLDNDIHIGAIQSPHPVYVYESLTCTHCGDFNKEYLSFDHGQWNPLINKGTVGITVRLIARNVPDMIMDNVVYSLPKDKQLAFVEYVYTHQSNILNEWQAVVERAQKAHATSLKEEEVQPIIQEILHAINAPPVKAIDEQRIDALGKQEEKDMKAIGLYATPTVVYNRKAFDVGNISKDPTHY